MKTVLCLLVLGLAISQASVVDQAEEYYDEVAKNANSPSTLSSAIKNYTSIPEELKRVNVVNQLEQAASSILQKYNINDTSVGSAQQSIANLQTNQQLNLLGSLLGEPLKLVGSLFNQVQPTTTSPGGRKLLSWK